VQVLSGAEEHRTGFVGLVAYGDHLVVSADEKNGPVAGIKAGQFIVALQGLLLPARPHKTQTALAGAEPIVEAQAGAVQRLRFFLSESPWDAEALNACRLALLLSDRATAPHADGVLVIDDTGDRKAGTHTAHVARQWLGSVGKVDNGIVAISSLWAHERVYYPLHLRPYTPGSRLALGKKDPAFRTKPQPALELIGDDRPGRVARDQYLVSGKQPPAAGIAPSRRLGARRG
jgi:hypothetical protein